MATEEELRRRRELNAELERTNQLLRQEAESLGRVSEAFDSSLGSLEQINSLHNAIKNNVSETEGLSTTEIEKQKQFVQTLRERIDLEVKLGNITAEEGEERKNALTETQKQVDYMKEKDDIATKELNTVLKKDQNLINITEKFRNISSIGQKRLSTEELINARMQFGHMIISSVLEKVSQLAGKILDVALEVDSASRELMRTATFSYEEARRGLVDITTAAAGSGLTMAESAKTMGLLKEEFSAFTTLTKEGQTSVGAMVGVLDKMGFASASSAKFLDLSTKSLGVSYKQSLGYLSSLKGFADQAGVSMKKISADLASNADNLANYGQQGMQVFKEMEIASKQLGMAMSELFAITEKFTTFEGAAGAAAQLNAVLGGDFVNSVDLLTASLESPIDVFKQFKQGMDASGKSFDELDNGMKRVIASSMGVSVQQAGRLLGMDLNTATAAMKEQEQTQEKLNEMSNRMLNIMDKLKTAFAALYPALDPIIDVLATFADYFTTFATGFANFIKENDYLLIVFKMLAGVVGALGLALGVLGTTILPIYAQIKTIQLLFGGIGPAISFVTSKLGGFGAAIVNAISSTLSFAKAIVTNIIGSLFNAISAMLRFAISVTVNIVSSLFRAIGSIISFAGAMISSFVSSLLTAMIHIARFGIAMSVSIINAFASGARAALRFAGTLIASLIPSFSGIISTGFLAGTASTAAGEGAALGGTFAAIGAKGFLALGLAALMVGAGIGLAAWGISTIVDSLVDLVSTSDGSTQSLILISLAMLTTAYAVTILSVAMVAMVVSLGILALSGVGPAAVGLILAIGAAVLMASVGIYIISAGFSLIVESMIKMVTVGSQSADSLAMLGLAMLTTAYSITILTIAMIGMVASLGLLALSPAGVASVGLMFAIGAAAMIMGIGLAISATSLSFIAESFSKLLVSAKGANDSLLTISITMITTAVSIAILASSIVAMVVTLSLLAFSGVGQASVLLLYAIGAAVIMMSSAFTIASFGISLIIDSISNLVTSSIKLVNSLNSVDSNVVSNYIKLVEVFSDLADSINKIDLGILTELNRISVGNIGISAVTTGITGTPVNMVGPSTRIETTTNTTEKVSSDYNAKKEQPIYINVKIDSPVEINKNTIGRYMAEYSGQIVDDKLKQARQADV